MGCFMVRFYLIAIFLCSAGAFAADEPQSIEEVEIAAATESPVVAIEETTDSSPSTKSNFEIGVLLGISETSFTNQVPNAYSMQQTSNEIRLTGGVSLNYFTSEHFSLESGLFVVQRAIGYDSFTVNGLSKTMFNMNAIEVPVMARAWLNQYLSVAGGMYTSFGVGWVATTNTINGNEVMRSEANYNQAGLHTFDYGFLFGLQAKIPVHPSVSLLLDTRYNLGLRDLRIAPFYPDVNETWVRMFRFSAGASFAL